MYKCTYIYIYVHIYCRVVNIYICKFTNLNTSIYMYIQI